MCILACNKRVSVEVNTVLVGLGLYDGRMMLDLMKDEIEKNPNKKYFLKVHPKDDLAWFSNSLQKWGLSNAELGTKDLVYYLSTVEEVVTTNSSVGYEAYLLGIPSRTMVLPNQINDSPLLDIEEKR